MNHRRRMHGMITCREFEDFIIEYLEGELSWGKRVLFNMHLAVCRECRRYLSAYRESLALGQAVLRAEADEIPPDVPEDLITAVVAAMKSGEDP